MKLMAPFILSMLPKKKLSARPTVVFVMSNSRCSKFYSSFLPKAYPIAPDNKIAADVVNWPLSAKIPTIGKEIEITVYLINYHPIPLDF